jgi:hypothetical protein
MANLVQKKVVMSEIASSSGMLREFPSARNSQVPNLVNTQDAARILSRSVATLKRWRCEGIGPNWIELEGRVSYDVAVLVELHPKEHTSCFRAGSIGENS